MLEKLIGKWTGRVTTWFEPEKVADESDVSGEFSWALDGAVVRHVYSGSMQGKPRTGEELIARDKVTGRYQIAWFDSFHMNYALLLSEGDATGNGFSVLGHYAYDPNEPEWGWRTAFDLEADDRLTVTAYNVTPDGLEAKAVEIIYRRV